MSIFWNHISDFFKKIEATFTVRHSYGRHETLPQCHENDFRT
ncbi:unnamed protein product [Brassica rapa]|uniref:Uncharacterized protein n=1 Tax=Brassica campestris TaxID=3711 RepID=A0A8D9CPR7_BRACM|nr:unnamed protein product [Brassica rapa]